MSVEAFHVGMPPSSLSVSRETARRSRQMRFAIGEQVRRLRLDAGVSLAELSRVVGIHRSYLARIEAGGARPSLEVLTTLGVGLGADVSVRFFSGSGPRIRDRFQAVMCEALLAALHPRWEVALEVPVRTPSRGVIDLVLRDRRGAVVVAGEVQSQLTRLEEQIRWLNEKALALHPVGPAEDGRREVSKLLLLRSTVATRELARRYESVLRTAYPARAADVVAALMEGADWPGAGIAWMYLESGRATLMAHAPRGVRLGR